MTNDDWKLIAKAWADWVNGEGPPVQGRYVEEDWRDWTKEGFINREQCHEWRVKPAKRLARFYRIGEGTGYAIKREHDPDPELKEGQRYFGEWQEIPE